MKVSTFALIFTLWLGSFYASTIMAYTEFISLWYMPAGISFAAFLVFGKRAFFPLFLGIWLVSAKFDIYLKDGFDPTLFATSLLFSLAHTLSYGVGGLAARHWLSHYIKKPLPIRIIGLLVIAIVAALLASFSGLFVWQFATDNYQNIISDGWFAWWLGDLIGVIVLMPVLALLFTKVTAQKLAWIDCFFDHDKRLPSHYTSYVFKLLTAVLIIIGIMWLDHTIHHPGVAYFIFLIAIPQIWIVLSEKASLASLSLVIMTSVIAYGIGIFAVTDQAMTYQFSLFVMASMSYFALSVPVLAEQNSALKELSMFDTLTKLPSRWLAKMLVDQVIKSSKPNQNHSLALFNIDHFSVINSDYGDTVGDTVLHQLANSLSHEIRDSEILCHCQADTFIVFMPNNDLSQAQQRAEELRRKMPVLRIDDLVLPIRSSFGVVQVQFGDGFDETIQRAQQAMQQAKANGRNKVVAVA